MLLGNNGNQRKSMEISACFSVDLLRFYLIYDSFMIVFLAHSLGFIELFCYLIMIVYDSLGYFYYFFYRIFLIYKD